MRKDTVVWRHGNLLMKSFTSTLEWTVLVQMRARTV